MAIYNQEEQIWLHKRLKTKKEKEGEVKGVGWAKWVKEVKKYKIPVINSPGDIMCNMVTIVNNTEFVNMKVAKTVNLKSSFLQE